MGGRGRGGKAGSPGKWGCLFDIWALLPTAAHQLRPQQQPLPHIQPRCAGAHPGRTFAGRTFAGRAFAGRAFAGRAFAGRVFAAVSVLNSVNCKRMAHGGWRWVLVEWGGLRSTRQAACHGAAARLHVDMAATMTPAGCPTCAATCPRHAPQQWEQALQLATSGAHPPQQGRRLRRPERVLARLR